MRRWSELKENRRNGCCLVFWKSGGKGLGWGLVKGGIGRLSVGNIRLKGLGSFFLL